MRVQPWWWSGSLLVGVAVATAMAGACPPMAAAQGFPGPLSGDSFRLVAVPEPPAPPRPPSQALAEAPAAPDERAEEVAEAEAEDTPSIDIPSLLSETGAVERLDERRNDATVRVPPGVPVPTYPVVVNAPVEALIDHFVAKDRERFGMWISRSGRYLPMIQRIFRERGLPEELAYTAMIESGFSPRAVSRVGAKGMWQFMEATGRRYGLVIDRWIDERLDPVKSTMAAAEYLGDLYGLFGHWFLAQAGYNAGENRVGRAIQRAQTSDFWALTQTRHLPDETKLFVPQILAAAVITRAPTRYGFDVTLESGELRAYRVGGK